MSDCVDRIVAIFFADPLQRGFDIQTRVEGGPVVFCDDELTDAMDDDEAAIAGAGEIVNGVYFDGGESEDLMVDRGAWDEEEIFGFDVEVLRFPNMEKGFHVVRGDDLNGLVGGSVVDVAGVGDGWVLKIGEWSKEEIG